jgi:hypothetical protein
MSRARSKRFLRRPRIAPPTSTEKRPPPHRVPGPLTLARSASDGAQREPFSGGVPAGTSRSRSLTLPLPILIAGNGCPQPRKIARPQAHAAASYTRPKRERGRTTRGLLGTRSGLGGPFPLAPSLALRASVGLVPVSWPEHRYRVASATSKGVSEAAQPAAFSERVPAWAGLFRSRPRLRFGRVWGSFRFLGRGTVTVPRAQNQVLRFGRVSGRRRGPSPGLRRPLPGREEGGANGGLGSCVRTARLATLASRRRWH